MFWHSLFFVGTMKCRSQWIWLVKRREFPVWMQLICEKMTALHAAPARRINSCLILFVDFISWRQLLVCYLWFYICLCAWVLMFIFWHTVMMERCTTGFAKEMSSECVALGLSSHSRRQCGVRVFAISINGPWSFGRICIPCCLILRPRLHMSCFYYI